MKNIWSVENCQTIGCDINIQSKHNDIELSNIETMSEFKNVNINTTLTNDNDINKQSSIKDKPDINNSKVPTYKSRWHYTSDRIKNNPYTIDITESIIQKENMDSVTIVLNKKSDGSEFLDLNWTFKNKIYFIPTNQINESLLSKLPEVCGAAFVQKSYFKNGIVIEKENFKRKFYRIY